MAHTLVLRIDDGIAPAAAATQDDARCDRATGRMLVNTRAGKRPTYRTTESVIVASGGSDIAELRGVTGKVGRVKRITIAKPSVAFNLTVVKRSSLDTGGSATTPAMVPLDSGSAAAALTVKGYTAKPTAGTTVGGIYVPVNVGTTDIITINFGESDSEDATVRVGEAIALVSDIAVTVSYLVEHTEATT